MEDFVRGVKLKPEQVLSFGELDFRFGSFYNIFGKNKTGKTALCLYISNKLLQSKNKVFYVETEGKFYKYEALRSEK